MTDRELLERFEAGTLAPEELRHAEHVRLVWLHLRSHGALETLARVGNGLRRLAAAVGRPELYHETVTWGWVLLIAQRMRESAELDWGDFRAAHADLFDRAAPALSAYYSPELLARPEAREAFVLPDRVPG
jgi:hypothetical protein